MVVLVFLESAVAHVTPQNRGHAQLMRVCESPADLDNLAVALLRAEIDRGAYGGWAHVVRDLHGREKHLIELVWVGEQFVVIQLHDERDFVRVLSGDGAEDAAGSGHSVTPAFYGEFYDIFRVEVVRVFCETCARGVLDPLVYGKYRKIAGFAKAAVRVNPLQIGENANVPIGTGPNAIDEIGPGEMEAFLGNFW